jgi:ATP-dependent helicase/nuclease subunit B
MGDIAHVEVADNAQLQQRLMALIEQAQARDPLAPVTLVVDSPAQGWALRRQLVRARSVGSGLANLRTVTVTELLGELAPATGVTVPGSADDVLRAAVTEATLRAQTGPLAASRDHPETAVRLGALADQLAWCALDPETVDAMTAESVSLTARAAVAFAAQARAAVAVELREPDWPRVCTAIVEHLGGDPGRAGLLGTVLVAAGRLPNPVREVLGVLSDSTTVVRVRVDPGRLPIEAQVVSYPDPATESAMAVRLVAEAILDGTAPDRIAVLYSSPLPYARLLEDAFAAARIEWHGPTGRTLQATAVARHLAALLAMAAARTTDQSGITRPLLMRWLALGGIHAGSSYAPTGAFRSLIRQEGLFGDAANWLAHLRAIAVAHAEADPDDDAPDRHRSHLAPYAEPLVDLIARLDDDLRAIATADTWTQLGGSLWSALEAFHLQGGWWQARTAESATVDAVRSVLQESLPAIDVLREWGGHPSMSPRAADVAQILSRTLSSRRGRHGASSVGVHVGPVGSARGLTFDRLVLVGASDGLLPPVRGDDPLLPDDLRLALRRHADDLPRSVEAEEAIGADVRALASACGSCVATFSRGALPGKAVGLPSRYLGPVKPPMVGSARGALRELPPPVTSADLAIRAGIGDAVPPAELTARVASIDAWAHPGPGKHFGAVGTPDGRAAWTMRGLTLSASGIEQFLHCPYHFFVQRVLGLSTDEYQDEVDTMAPSDMGSMLHRAFERLVVDSAERGALPGYGEAWPDSALADLQAHVREEVAAAQALGLTGWRPAWDRSFGIVMTSLPAFLTVDHEKVRSDPPTRPESAERSFGFDGDPVVEFPVTDDIVVRLRGSIDRVDVAEDPRTIGVVDYKSGRSSGFAAKLGAPDRHGNAGSREKVQDLVYDVAARALFPDAELVEVRFLFVPNGGKDPEVVRPTHDADRAASLRDILQRMERAGATGTFTPTPSGGRDYCPVCTRLGRRALIVSGSDPDPDLAEAEGDDS